MKDLITVLLPTYNGQKYIKHMLDSIYMQDYRPLELLVADDASKDNTVGVVVKWWQSKNTEDITFKVFRNKKNKGLSKNISDVVCHVCGKYLFLADQDDIWRTEKISKQIEYLEKNPDCVMCFCDRSVINKDGKIVCRSLFQYKHADIEKRDYKKMMSKSNLFPANCMCLRTEYLNNIFPIPAQVCEHDIFITIMALHYGKVGYLCKALTLYRIHGENLSGQYALETNRNLFKAGCIIFKGFQRKDQRVYNDFPLIKRELVKRFDENDLEWLKQKYLGRVKHRYWETILYIYRNFDKWKKFC